jgi:hypothetical protein
MRSKSYWCIAADTYVNGVDEVRWLQSYSMYCVRREFLTATLRLALLQMWNLSLHIWTALYAHTVCIWCTGILYIYIYSIFKKVFENFEQNLSRNSFQQKKRLGWDIFYAHMYSVQSSQLILRLWTLKQNKIRHRLDRSITDSAMWDTEPIYLRWPKFSTPASQGLAPGLNFYHPTKSFSASAAQINIWLPYSPLSGEQDTTINILIMQLLEHKQRHYQCTSVYI